MKCIKCKYKNPYQANYCYKCGNKFTEEERKKASNEGITGLLKTGRKLYDALTLSTITSNIYFRIISVLIVLGIGIYGIIIHGYKLKIEESDSYTYQYNKKLDEYYLYTKDNETKVNLYSLGNNDKMTVEYYGEDDRLISRCDYLPEDIILNANSFSDNYYVLKTNNDNIKIYVYKDNN